MSVQSASAPNLTTTRTKEAGSPLLIFRYLRRNIQLTIGLGILLFFILFSVVGSLYVDEKAAYPLGAPASQPPSLTHPFGTDGQGRELLAVAVFGIWETFRIGFIAGVIGLCIGAFIGFTSAFFGGWYDVVVRWVVDVLLTVPGLLILIVIASSMDAKSFTLTSMAYVIALTAWMGPARTIRAQVLTLRERSYVMMARLNGMNSWGIIFRELLPNLLPYLGASLVGSVTGAIFASVGLPALGLGPLREPTIGVTIYWAMNQNALLREMWWWLMMPIVTIILMFVMLFMISVGLDEIANPRVRRAE
ncbi:MAG: ABC transporter permease [Caldilineaceae bacterium]|nr:ABC transporter permease [Caldilineaceae bacterium]